MDSIVNINDFSRKRIWEFSIFSQKRKKEFVVLPYSEFLALQELVEDAKDLIELRKAKRTEKNAPTTSFNEVAKEIDL